MPLALGIEIGGTKLQAGIGDGGRELKALVRRPIDVRKGGIARGAMKLAVFRIDRVDATAVAGFRKRGERLGICTERAQDDEDAYVSHDRAAPRRHGYSASAVPALGSLTRCSITSRPL